jgi:hypothetical protein
MATRNGTHIFAAVSPKANGSILRRKDDQTGRTSEDSSGLLCVEGMKPGRDTGAALRLWKKRPGADNLMDGFPFRDSQQVTPALPVQS